MEKPKEPWRSLGQVRTASTAPVVGGPSGPTHCPPPRKPGQLGTTWQFYHAPCPNK